MECAFVNLLGIVGRAPQVAGLIYYVTSLAIEGNTGLRIVHPTFAIALKVRVLAHTCLCPRLDAEGHALVSTLHDFNLGDVWLSEVDAEVLEHGVFRADERHREHASVEDEVRSCPVEGQVLPVLECQAYRFRVRLVVVGDVIFFLYRTIGMEVIASLFKDEGHCLAFVLLLDERQGFLHLGREVFFCIGHDAIVPHQHGLFIRASSQHQSQHT